jgi:DNA-directed RNA polymerase specialized sigma24 family protein
MPLDEAAASCEVSLATLKRRIAEAELRIERKLAE